VKEFHVETTVLVVVQLPDDATEEDAEQAVTNWLVESCPFDEMELDPMDVSRCTADEELRQMHSAKNN
jgi:hypothetical protein